MNKNVLFFYLLTFLIFTSSCSKDDESPSYFQVGPTTELFFDCVESNYTLHVTSSSKWTVDSNCDWISTSINQGETSADVEILVSANETFQSREGQLTFKCQSTIIPVFVTQYGKINTPYVDLDLDNPNVETQFDENTGIVNIRYQKNVDYELAPGNVIILPSKYLYDIRVIEDATINDKNILINTTQGNMSNLFSDISFTLTTAGRTNTRSTGTERVVFPQSIGFLDQKGNYIDLKDAQTRADITVSQDLLNFNLSFDGEELYNGPYGRLFWDKCNFNSSLNGSFTFNFGNKNISKDSKIGDLQDFSYILSGNFATNFLMKYLFSYKHSEKKDEIIKYNVLPTGVLRFTIGAVPVVILIYTHLGQYSNLDVEGKCSAEMGTDFDAHINMGLNWNKNSGVTPISDASANYSLTVPTFDVLGSMVTKISYYPQIEIGIYKFIGPWAEPRIYLKEDFKANIGGSINGVDNLSWTSNTYSGMDLRLGLKFDFGMFDKEVWKSKIFNVKDLNIFKAPYRITTVYPSEITDVENGQSIRAEFLVESFSSITDSFYPCPFALVKFSTKDGNVDTEFAIADINGKVYINWSPKKNATLSRNSETTNSVCILEASIIDEKNTPIQTAQAKVSIKDSKAVDLGLSVKWASYNLGATSIGDPGFYLGWGELQQKDKTTPYDEEHHEYSYPVETKEGEVEWHYHNIGMSICGTQYDPVRYYWGGNWRMPTEEEAKELIEKCRFEHGTENGLSGRWAIGPNGNKVFFPSGGFTNPTLNDVKEHHYNGRGWYWTGDISTTLFESGTFCNICNHLATGFITTSGISSLSEALVNSERARGMTIRPVLP